MPFLDDMIGVHDITVNGGAPLPRRSVLNIVAAGALAVDNPAAGRTDLTLPSSISGSTITPTALAGDVNDYAPTGHVTAAYERWSSGSTPRSVTGLDASGLPIVAIMNVGAATITLAHNSSSSLAANRILCPNNVAYDIAAGAAAQLVRDTVSSRWRVVS